MRAVAILLTHQANQRLLYSEGETALMRALYQQNFLAAELLIEHGSPLNVYDYSRNSALSLAIEQNQVKLVKLMLQRKINVNSSNQLGLTPLIRAAMNESFQIASLLIRAGALLNFQAPESKTNALMEAVKNNHLALVQLLIKEGANLNLLNAEGKSALKLAREKNYTRIYRLLEKSGARL